MVLDCLYGLSQLGMMNSSKFQTRTNTIMVKIGGIKPPFRAFALWGISQHFFLLYSYFFILSNEKVARKEKACILEASCQKAN